MINKSLSSLIPIWVSVVFIAVCVVQLQQDSSWNFPCMFHTKSGRVVKRPDYLGMSGSKGSKGAEGGADVRVDVGPEEKELDPALSLPAPMKDSVNEGGKGKEETHEEPLTLLSEDELDHIQRELETKEKEVSNRLKLAKIERITFLRNKIKRQEVEIEVISDGNLSVAEVDKSSSLASGKQHGGARPKATFSKPDEIAGKETAGDLREMKILQEKAEIVSRKLLGSFDPVASTNGKTLFSTLPKNLGKSLNPGEKSNPKKKKIHRVRAKDIKIKKPLIKTESSDQYCSTSESDNDSDISNCTSNSTSSQTKSKKSKKKSGKNSKVADQVKNVLKWPHTGLKCALSTDRVNYEGLDSFLFVAGYLNNVTSDFKDKTESNYDILKKRIKHLERIMFLAKLYSWKSILLYNESVFNLIEQGDRAWGDSFTDLEFLLTTKPKSSYPTYPNNSYKGTSSYTSNHNNNTNKDWYCSRYQRNMCTLSGAHSAFFVKDNLTRRVDHFCANCWLTEGSKKPHSSQDCPSNNNKAPKASSEDKSGF